MVSIPPISGKSCGLVSDSGSTTSYISGQMLKYPQKSSPNFWLAQLLSRKKHDQHAISKVN